MIKSFKSPIIYFVLSLIVIFASCSDWTDTESVKLVEADIEKDNPELYAQYLSNLRNYRNTNHRVLYASFDNIEGTPNSRGQRIEAVPDSVDIVSLTNPDNLSSLVISEMEKVRNDKGMKFIFNISYVTLEKEYEQYILQNPGEEGEDQSVDKFLAYAAEFVDKHLALVDKYGYDGISVLFYGMKTSHLSDAAKEEYLAREAAFMSKISGWVNANSSKLFVFEGYPQNLTDKSVLQKAKYIVIRTELLKYATRLDYEVLLCIEDGVPTDRFIVTAITKSLDPTDEKTGYYFNSNNELVPSIPLAADWVDAYQSKFTKAGLAILSVQNDYYNSGKSYFNIRNAISTMNPSPKF